MSRDMRAFLIICIVFTAFIFSFCGGPLLVADLLKPHFGDASGLVAMAPLMVVLYGAFPLMALMPPIDSPRRSKLDGYGVLAGLVAVMVVGLMNAFALWQFAVGADHPNRSLIIWGIAIGTALSVAYVHLARRYLHLPPAPQRTRRIMIGTLPFLAPRPARPGNIKESATFIFGGPDSLLQGMVVLVLILGAGCIPIPFFVWSAGGMIAAAVYIFAALAVAIGLRNSIIVTPSLVVITRSWFFIPYWRYTGRAIEDVWFDGDWGLPEGAGGVVVKLDGQEVHIGSCKTMHHLYESLWPMRAPASQSPCP